MTVITVLDCLLSLHMYWYASHTMPGYAVVTEYSNKEGPDALSK